MALNQSVGASIGVSATLPTTWDSNATTGFPARTYTAVGFVNSVPDLDGEYDIANFENLQTGEELKFADILRAGEGTFQVGLDVSDAGQTIINSNIGSKVALKFTLKGGKIYYRSAIIKSFKPTNIGVGNVVMAEISLAFERNTVKV